MKFLIITFIFLLSSCADREYVINKCTDRGLEIFDKTNVKDLANYVQSCMVEKGFVFLRSCNPNNDSDFLVALCYISQDEAQLLMKSE